MTQPGFGECITDSLAPIPDPVPHCQTEIEWMDEREEEQLEDQLQVSGGAHEKVNGDANRAGSHGNSRPQSRALASVKILKIPLARIQISAESLALQQQMKMKPLPELTIADEFAALGTLVRPPFVIEDPQHPGSYLTVDDGRIMQWLVDRLGSIGVAKYKVSALVIEAPKLAASVVAATHAFLMPLLLGELTSREVRQARRQLKDAGITRPRRRGRRQQLVHLVRR